MAPVYPQSKAVQFPDPDGWETQPSDDTESRASEESGDNRFPGDAMLSDPE